MEHSTDPSVEHNDTAARTTAEVIATARGEDRFVDIAVRYALDRLCAAAAGGTLPYGFDDSTCCAVHGAAAVCEVSDESFWAWALALVASRRPAGS